ncbi:hypothetical protein Droror1_Dr00023528 [Drosera rotundifolia]
MTMAKGWRLRLCEDEGEAPVVLANDGGSEGGLNDDDGKEEGSLASLGGRHSAHEGGSVVARVLVWCFVMVGGGDGVR